MGGTWATAEQQSFLNQFDEGYKSAKESGQEEAFFSRVFQLWFVENPMPEGPERVNRQTVSVCGCSSMRE